MRSIAAVVLALVCGAAYLNASAITAPDTVTGTAVTWDADTVLLGSDVVLADSAALTIAAGTYVLATGPYRFTVNGCLKAEGTVADSIIFTARDTAAGWEGFEITSRADDSDTVRFDYCRISHGKKDQGGGFRIRADRVIISHTLVERGDATYAGGIYADGAAPVLRGVAIARNTGVHGGGIYLAGASGTPLLDSCLVTANHASFGPGVYISSCSPRVHACLITDNSGVGLYLNNDTTAIINTEVSGNHGPGISAHQSRFKMYNSLVRGNEATFDGAALSMYEGSPRIINSTITANRPGGTKPVISGGTPVFINSIIWGNAQSYTGQTVQSADPVFRNCCVQNGLAGIIGDGDPADFNGVYEACIDTDPLFADTATGDYTLSGTSPCLNAGGADTAGLGLPVLDLAGQDRIYDGTLAIVDMGAFEFQSDPTSSIAPVAHAMPDRYLLTGQALVCTAAATGYPAPAFSLVSAPAGMTIGSVSGLIEWAPASGQTGPDSVMVRAANSAGADTARFTVTVFDAATSQLAGGTLPADEAWQADTVRLYTDVIIPSGVTVTVTPGTYVQSYGYHGVYINGTLLAAGTEADSITFGCSDTALGWYGLVWDRTPAASDTSVLRCCILTGAREKGSATKYGGAVLISNTSVVRITRCRISRNQAKYGGGVCIDGGVPLFHYNLVTDNRAYKGGGLLIGSQGLVLQGLTIRGNYASSEGGGIHGEGYTLVNGELRDNVTTMYGGGICTEGNVTCVNVLLAGNRAPNSRGGGIYADWYADVTVVNSTIAYNHSHQGGGIYGYYAACEVTNSILWGNTGSDLGSIVLSQTAGFHSTITFNYCDVQQTVSGFANLNVYPAFTDTTAADYTLREGSPCINAGTPDTAGLGLPVQDLAGADRISGSAVDMGPYEYLEPAAVPPSPVPVTAALPVPGRVYDLKGKPVIGPGTASGVYLIIDRKTRTVIKKVHIR